MRALAIGALGAALLFGGASCVSPSTELVVVIRSEIPVPSELDRLDVEVEGDTLRALATTVVFSRDTAFPQTVGLRPASGSQGSVTITLVGWRGPNRRLERVVRTAFVPGARRLVVIDLDAPCLDHAACAATETCRGGDCVSSAVDPATLPPFTGTIPVLPRDAGVDGGRPLDAPSTDAPDAPATDAPDAPSCTGDASTMGEPPGCTLRHPPARPTCGDGGDDGTVRTFALLDPIVDQLGATWMTYGFDLDGLCTDPLETSPAVECASPGGMPPADGLEGIDNTLGGTATGAIVAFFPSYPTGFRNTVRHGMSAPLLRVSGWNGEADDAQVDVVVAFAVDVLPAGTAVPPTGLVVRNGLPDPAWDGTDTAYPSATYFTPPPASLPLIRDDSAYVADHRLVVALPDRAPIDLAAHAVSGLDGVLRIRLTGARMVAQLSDDGTSIESAVLVGRFAYTDVLAYLDDLGVCPGDPVVDTFLTAFTTLLQRSLDVRSTLPSPGPTAPCDAMSLALPFASSSPVIWGDIQSVMLTPEDCAP